MKYVTAVTKVIFKQVCKFQEEGVIFQAISTLHEALDSALETKEELPTVGATIIVRTLKVNIFIALKILLYKDSCLNSFFTRYSALEKKKMCLD